MSFVVLIWVSQERLLEQGKIVKMGKAPHVFYSFNGLWPEVEFDLSLNADDLKVIQDSFLYIDPYGRVRYGEDGMRGWFLHQSNHIQSLTEFAQDYVKIRRDYFPNTKGVVRGIGRFRKIDKNSYLQDLFYGDYFSLPKFGKTKLSKQLYCAKEMFYEEFFDDIVGKTAPLIEKIIYDHNIEAVAFVPNFLPRKCSFMKLFREKLNLSVFEIELAQVSRGNIAIPQAYFNNLSGRREKVSQTIIIKTTKFPKNRILIIDDFVDSGATMLEVAKKFKSRGVKNTYGFAVVGSMKGFEVISEV